MSKDIVGKTILTEKVSGVVRVIVRPILRQFLRTQDQHRFVAQLVILNDGKCCECLTQTNRVCQNTATIGLKFVNYACRSVMLEVIQAFPDLGFLVAGAVVGQHVVINVV